MATKAKRIEISVEDRTALKWIVRSRKADRQMVERAPIGLEVGEGRSAEQIRSQSRLLDEHDEEVAAPLRVLGLVGACRSAAVGPAARARRESAHQADRARPRRRGASP
jgi:hypothetical protein